MKATRLDNLIGSISPAWRDARLADRAERARLSYEAARPGRERAPPQPLRGPDNIIHQMESVQMIARAEELARDSSFIKSIVERFKMHVVGNLQYIPTVGTRAENQAYREYWQAWCKKSDITTRFHFVDQMNMGIGGCLIQGDHGIIHHHHEDGTYQIQNIEGENIGNPRTVVSGNGNIIRGVVLRDGVPVAYQIFRQTVSSQFVFVREVPASHFTHLNPVSRSDEYKAKTPFHAVLNDAHDFRRIEKAWMSKIQWAGYKVGMVNTPNGMAPAPSQNYLDSPGDTVTRGRLQPMAPGEVLYGETGMTVDMIENNTPSPQEMEFMLVKLQQIAGALNLPLPYLYVMMGIPGTYTRLIGEWASRTFEDGPIGQRWLQRTALDDIKNRVFMSAIIRDELPWVKNWTKGTWMFPARSSVDVGRESKANLDENAAGLRSMARICSEEGVYWQDEDEQLATEAENKIELAIMKAKGVSAKTGTPVQWQEMLTHIQMMGPNPMPAKEEQPEAQKKSSPIEEQLSKLQDQIEGVRTRLDKSWDEDKHPRNHGEFAPKGGGDGGGEKSDNSNGKKSPSTKTKAATSAAVRTPAPQLSEKAARAKAAHFMVDKTIQRYAEEHNEPRMAKSLGGVSFPDGEPIDIAIAGTNGVVKHGIELKTVVSNSNGKITMKGDAIARKKAWERKNKATIHTVVIDDSEVFNAKGPGKHDESKRKIYYRRGYGSFRYTGMHQVKDVEELKQLLDTPTKKLPPGAK